MSSPSSKGKPLSAPRPDDRPTTTVSRGRRRIIRRRREVPRRPIRSTTSTAIAAITALLTGLPDCGDGSGVYSRVGVPRCAFVVAPRQQQQLGGAVQPLRRSGKGAVCCCGCSSSLAAAISRSARGRGTPCRWRRSPPPSSSSSSLALSLSSLSLLPNCDLFLPRHEAPASALLLQPPSPPSRIGCHVRQHQQHQQQHRQQRYRHRQTRASWWCLAMEGSETGSATETATATQQLLL
ncbi:unnamed protein product, partial [Laminaria digitata]